MRGTNAISCGATTALLLTDFPSAYTSSAGKLLVVNQTPDAVAFSSTWSEGATGILAGGNMRFGMGDFDTGAEVSSELAVVKNATDAIPLALVNSGVADAADKLITAVIYDVGAASITNAATMRLLSLGWTNDSDAYAELASFRANGDLYVGSSSLKAAGTLTMVGSASAQMDFNPSSARGDAVLGTAYCWYGTQSARAIGIAANPTNQANSAAVFATATIAATPNDDYWTFYNSYSKSAGAYLPAGGWKGQGRLHTAGGIYGEYAVLDRNTEEVTIAAAASTDTTMTIPAYAVLLGVSVRVTTVIPDATAFDVTFDGDTLLSAVAVAATTTAAAGAASLETSGSPQALTIGNFATSNPAAATGKVRITAHWFMPSAPTS